MIHIASVSGSGPDETSAPTLSSRAFFRDLQTNSMMATMMASASPAMRTTKMPPTFSTPRALALELLSSSSRTHVPVSFHHLLYSIWILPFSCSPRMAMDSLSLYGESGGMTKESRLMIECHQHQISIHTFGDGHEKGVSARGKQINKTSHQH